MFTISMADGSLEEVLAWTKGRPTGQRNGK